jgi:hypothetical protein
MNQAGKLSVSLSAIAAALAFPGANARAQLVPDLAFEGVDGMVQILAERRLERAGQMMAGKAASTPRSQTGISGANGSASMTAWIATGGTHLASRANDAEYSGDHYNGAVGMDMAVEPWLILGVSLGFENRDLDTFFNDGQLESTGGTVSPYFIARLHENIFVDGSFSYARLNNDLERNDFPFTNLTTFGNYGSNRYVGTTNLHGVLNVDDWRLGVQVGYLHVHQDDESYRHTGGCETTVCTFVPAESKDLGQVRAGGRIGYAFGDFVPYVTGRVEYDVVEPTSFGVKLNDRLGGFVGAGMRWNIERYVSLSAQGNTIVARDRQTNYGGFATFRFSW